ncbi:MAG TPA: helix-turn-helix domain-containing protein [Solirubrobacterales bacterium]|nr:helix-turn-helix domain-containing protein [Solirubrobacterales bacterium]
MCAEEQQIRADVQRNRDNVLKAAVRVLSENPEASMQDIAEASDLGRTTVYRHFPSREVLVRALFAQLVDEASRRFGESLELGGSAAECLERLGPVVAELAAEYRFLAVHRELERGIEEPGEGDPLRVWIERAHADGELTRLFPAEWQYRMLGAIARGAAEELLAGRMGVGETGEMLGRLFVRAFAADPDPTG